MRIPGELTNAHVRSPPWLRSISSSRHSPNPGSWLYGTVRAHCFSLSEISLLALTLAAAVLQHTALGIHKTVNFHRLLALRLYLEPSTDNKIKHI